MSRSTPAAERWRETTQDWVWIADGAPYFVTEEGVPWTPVGQNDSITWPELQGLYKRKDVAGVEAYVRMLAEHGVTCLRLMLEYSQSGYRYFERSRGAFNPALVQLWDDLFDLCRRYRLKVLLTAYDTFWMWNKWHLHPYNSANGGPCRSRRQWLLCSDTRSLIKRRLDFVTERWGGDGVIFAWDLWNEIHPAHAEDNGQCISDFVQDISTHLRKTEQKLHGSAHLQTVSVFHPVLQGNKVVADIVYRHPSLDMVNIHLYEHGAIDDPKNTVDAALSTGKLIAEAIRQTPAGRPVFDSEHGPIHTFKDRHRTLPNEFDDQYFRHIQWAHLASGGAGGGMRWPNRHPHCLTPGMREEQRRLGEFLSLIQWQRFQRRTLTGEIQSSRPGVECFGCADASQAVLYLLRRDTLQKNGMLDPSAAPVRVDIPVPGFQPGAYRVTAFDIDSGVRQVQEVAHFNHDSLQIQTPPFVRDLAVAITRRSR